MEPIGNAHPYKADAIRYILRSSRALRIFCSQVSAREKQRYTQPKEDFEMNRTKILAVTLPFILASCGDANLSKTPGDMMICTQDAMQCPDGAWVSRSGPKCEFVFPPSNTQSKPK